MIENEKPDLVLLDIQLKGIKDGIDLAWKIKESYDLPFIFLTANFNRDDLFTAIEICIQNFAKRRSEFINNEYAVSDSIFVKDGYYFHKIRFDDIIYLEAENNYVAIHTNTTKILVRMATVFIEF